MTPVVSPAARGRLGRHQRGFTLIEVGVTLAVAGILSSIALPSVEGQVQRVRRTDALVAALQVQMSQERHRGNAGSYGSLSEIGVAPRSAAGHYALQIANAGADGYELVATAVGTQARDAACRVLKLSSSGLNVAHASGSDAAASNPAELNRKCWSL